MSKLKNVEFLSTPRNFGLSRKHLATAEIELHVYCDASLRGYGCVAYCRKIFDGSQVEVSFVMAKGRVAPLKGDYSIHRLELLGAIIAIRTANKICQAAEREFSSVTYWCDNACVLAWIRDDPSRWKQFISNRVTEIQNSSKARQWRYIRTAENPADLVSRADSLDSLEKREFWLLGPKWLRSANDPKEHSLNAESVQQDVSNERRAQCVVGAVVNPRDRDSIGLRQISSWEKAVRILAYARRWLTYKRKRITRQDKGREVPVITSTEYAEAEKSILKGIQLRNFSAELTTNLKNVDKSSQIYQFNPILDSDGLIRCESRLINSEEVVFDVARPIILPGEDEMVRLYLTWLHEKICLHAGGVAGMIQRARRRFLILRVRRAAAKVMHECRVCIKYRAKPGEEIMPPLPKFRIDRAPPFAVTGVDAAGPFTVKDDAGKYQKAWVMLFACPLTRAIRLELVRNLSTLEFLLAFRRFYNRNATVTQMISDNAAAFRRSAREMNYLLGVRNTEEVQQFMSRHQITWTFNVARAPWRVSFYERMFRMLKEPLRRVMARNILPAFEFMTLLTDFEKIINDRPLTAVSTDPNEPLPLKPSDLLGGYQNFPGLPDAEEVANALKGMDPAIFSQRWKAQQSILNSFWNRFKREYLQQLRSAHAAKPVKSRNIKEGDVVLVDDPAASRGYWPMAVVTEVSGGESSDGRRRTCTVRLASGGNGRTILVKRPIQLLYPIHVSQD
ncbi:uncharacterized protein LOC100905134 [Galendromus occidentalis]|uniref:Uncharacterized protein LOC100905134 n=1 Tax=Galendromus occidentalis TaxID=34638 RepID=A0AAJ6VWL5_9ACAR|nr:uncharacterized protein LOC100905134 [Galendromus occidentalis]